MPISTIEFEDKYYEAIAKKYGWQEILPDGNVNNMGYKDYAISWLKAKIVKKILAPEYLSFQENKIDEFKQELQEEADYVISLGIS